MSRSLPKGYSLLDIPVGKHPSRKLAKYHFQQVDYTAILQEYLDGLNKSDWQERADHLQR